MSIKDDLRPISKNRVIDLVQAAGIDVSDWGNYVRGRSWAAANPKYCYEWSFIQPGTVVVLNLWHSQLRERQKLISVSISMREEALRLEGIRAKPLWVKRARGMDKMIAVAFRDKLLVRVILNEGEMRRALSSGTRASVVKQRILDPLPWKVQSYDEVSGRALLVRGSAVVPSVDQFGIQDTNHEAPQQITVSGKVYVRDPAVRAAALARADGHCEYCGQPGFVTSDGRIFLETHHIIPLAAGGLDVISNVAAVCANHHREAHYGSQADLIRDHLLEVAAKTPDKRV